jgi:uncharacterized membrane protein
MLNTATIESRIVSMMQSTKDLKDRYQSLEAERANLESELEELRRTATNRVAALEGNVAAMREEVKGLRDILIAPAPVSAPTPVKVEPVKPVEPAAPVVADSGLEVKPSVETSKAGESDMDSILESLSGDELKVVELLQAHDRKYPQKQIRIDAKLSWLQANRVISHLVERGVVSIEKKGSIEIVVLSESVK